MEKFKNTLKSVNKFGLALILCAATLIITQSAFSVKSTASEYGLDNGVWYDYNSTPPAGKQYSCNIEREVICTYTFEGDPNDPLNTEMGVPTSKIGEFSLVDE